MKTTFQSSLKNLVILSIPAYLVAGALIWFGCVQYPRLVQDTGDGFPPGWIFYYVPWTLGGLLILGCFFLMWKNAGRRFVVGRHAIEYYRFSHQVFKTSWNNIAFTPPNPEKRRFRRMMISSGSNYEDIEEFFFPDFQQFADTVTEARKNGEAWRHEQCDRPGRTEALQAGPPMRRSA